MGKYMPSIWFKISKKKSTTLKAFHIFQKISDKNYGKKLLFGQFCVSLPFPVLKMLRNKEKNLGQAMLLVRNIV